MLLPSGPMPLKKMCRNSADSNQYAFLSLSSVKGKLLELANVIMVSFHIMIVLVSQP